MEYYVSVDGDDDYLGTEMQPFRTGQRAADVAGNPGEIVTFRSGTYDPFRVKYPGAENQPIVFRTYSGERATILGEKSGISTTPADGMNILIQELASYRNPIGWLVFDGFELSNADLDGIKGYNVHDLIIRNCDIHHSHNNGILMCGSRNVLLEKNRFHEGGYSGEERSHGHGLYITGNDYKVINNLFYGGEAYAIQMAAYDQSVKDYIQPGFENIQRWLVANNTFAFQKDRAAIVIWATASVNGICRDIEIVNDIFYKNAEGNGPGAAYSPNGAQIYSDRPDSVVENINIHHNVHYGKPEFISIQGTASIQEFENIEVDPEFAYADVADPGNVDLRLKSTSPAISIGVTLSETQDDFDGTARPQGEGFDVGAYEYTEEEMSVITDLQAIETVLRQHVLDLVAQADAIAQVIVDLQVLDDTLDAAKDVIEVD